MKKLNVTTLNVAMLEKELKVKRLSHLKRKESESGEPVSWLWESGDEILWDDGQTMLVKK